MFTGECGEGRKVEEREDVLGPNFLFCIGNLVSHNPLERQYLKQHATVEVYRLYAKTHERLCGRI